PQQVVESVTKESVTRSLDDQFVVLVTDHHTRASGWVALFAREEAGAEIVATAPPGRLVSHTGFKLGHGFTLALPVAAYISWAGTRVDGTGLAPDLSVDWSYFRRPQRSG